MNQRKFIMGVLMAIVWLSGCGKGASLKEENLSLSKDTMTEYLLRMDTEKREMILDISDWINRGKTEMNDMMHTQVVTYDEDTIFQDEQGSAVRLEDFKKGEKLAVSPSETIAYSIVQMTMAKEEKLDHFLAKGDDLHTVLLYEEGTIPPYDELDFEKHVPESFSGGISWIPYVEGLAVDYKEELGIEKFPLIMVFDRKGIVFQTDSIEELALWSKADHTREIIEEVTIYKVGGASEKSIAVFTDSKEIDDMKEAVQSAEKIPGLVNRADPQYRFTIGEKTYFLWIQEESGTLMDVTDTHTIYKLSDQSVEKVHVLLTSQFDEGAANF